MIVNAAAQFKSIHDIDSWEMIVLFIICAMIAVDMRADPAKHQTQLRIRDNTSHEA